MGSLSLEVTEELGRLETWSLAQTELVWLMIKEQAVDYAG